MNGMTSCPEYRQLIGVYVVGAIDPHERALMDAHLARCPGCREELASLAGLPALLGRVPVEEAARIAEDLPERMEPGPPPEGDLLTPLLDRVGHRRRVQKWRELTAAAAAAAAIAGLSAGLVTAGQGAPAGPALTGHWDTVQGTEPGTSVIAVVKYSGTPWGSRIAAEISGVAPGTTCELWVGGPDGTWQAAGSWTQPWARGGDITWYPASTWIPQEDVKTFKITVAGKTLVRIKAS